MLVSPPGEMGTTGSAVTLADASISLVLGMIRRRFSYNSIPWGNTCANCFGFSLPHCRSSDGKTLAAILIFSKESKAILIFHLLVARRQRVCASSWDFLHPAAKWRRFRFVLVNVLSAALAIRIFPACDLRKLRNCNS